MRRLPCNGNRSSSPNPSPRGGDCHLFRIGLELESNTDNEWGADCKGPVPCIIWLETRDMVGIGEPALVIHTTPLDPGARQEITKPCFQLLGTSNFAPWEVRNDLGQRVSQPEDDTQRAKSLGRFLAIPVIVHGETVAHISDKPVIP